jgi:hypothetical protein
MAKRKRIKRKTMICKTPHKKQKIKQYEPLLKPGMNSRVGSSSSTSGFCHVLQKSRQFQLH